MVMTKAKLFANGRSQAVRLPKEFRFDGDEVYVARMGSAVVLMPMAASWDLMFDSLEGFDKDFLSDRHQPSTEQRDPAFAE